MMEPLGSRVLVEPKKAETESAGGIILVQKKDAIQQIGTVIAVGEGHVLESGERLPITVKPGDTVLFARYAGTAVAEGGHHYLMLEERDLLARLHKEDAHAE